MLGLAMDERRRPFRPVTEEIALAELRQAPGKCLAFGQYPINRRVGETGQRHRARIDLVALSIPLVGNCLGEARARDGKSGPSGRAHRPVVEGDPESVRRRDDFGGLVEAFHASGGVRQRRAR